MVVTLLPMSAFAAANVVVTAVDVNVSAEKKDSEYRDASFNLRFPDGSVIKGGKFRLELSNGAQFVNPGTTLTGREDLAGKVTFEVVENILFATIADDVNVQNSKDVSIGVNAKLYVPNTGDVTVKVVDESNTGVGTLSEVKIAVVKEETTDLTVTVKDASKVIAFDGGDLSQFEIKNVKAVDAANKKLVVTLDNEGAKFAADTKVLIDGVAKANAVVDGKIELTNADLANAKSVIVIPKVAGMSRKATEGDATVYVAVEETTGVGADAKVKTLDSESAVIGKIVDYSVTLEVVEKGKKAIPDVWGGETAKVKVTVKGPVGSLIDRAIDFKVDGADVKYVAGNGFDGVEAKDDKGALTGFFKDGEFSYYVSAMNTKTSVEFYLDIKTDADKDGVATITAAQRGWEQKADLAKVTPKFKVEAKVNQVKKGERKETSDIVITEAKAGLLAKGDKISVAFKTRRDYTEFAAKPKFEATNGLKIDLDKITYEKGRTAVQYVVTRTSSKEAAVITLSDVKVLIDGSATDAEVKVYGQLNGDDVSSVKYIAVVKEYALGANKSMFTVGSTTYKVDEKEMTLLVAPYIKEGRVMLPIRAVSEALGLKVQWNAGTKTATFTDATKTAALVVGADTMYVNGTPIKLNAKAELKGGTTFVELRSLALAFGVDIAWDGATKTATVSR